MKTMGWDYYTLHNQPEHVVFAIEQFINAEIAGYNDSGKGK